jgi:hypothetical protein
MGGGGGGIKEKMDTGIAELRIKAKNGAAHGVLSGASLDTPLKAPLGDWSVTAFLLVSFSRLKACQIYSNTAFGKMSREKRKFCN